MRFTEVIRNAENTIQPISVATQKEIDRQKNIDRINGFIFGFDAPIEDESVILSIQETPICSVKNISLLLGLRKNGKSTVLSLLLGDNNGTIQRTPPPGKEMILVVDTEQSGKYLRKLQDRIVRCLGRTPDSIMFLKVRALNKRERLELIRLTLDTYPQIGLVIIDNIKDVCGDFNDQSEADRIATMLVQWSNDYNLHILNVLHLNKGNGLSRGHLGSELENKAETILKVRKDDQNELVIVEPEATRDKPFEKFGFYFDESGFPVIQKLDSAERKPGKRTRDAYSQSPAVLSGIIDAIFAASNDYTYDGLWRAIKNAGNKYSLNLGDNTAKDWLTYYKQEGMIMQNERKRYVRSLTGLN